ncbi:inner membrane protein YbbJ [bacterium MnTg02]|nr:inner membrane protein YbbJ [bacterium MnTg02]
MNLISFFGELGEWTWLIAAAVLFILEIAVPGLFLLFFALAAAVVGVLALLVDMPWQAELVIFGAFSFVGVMFARKYWTPDQQESERPLLNQRAQQFVGRQYVLAEPIVNGRGKVRIGDSLWQVSGPDLAEGERVKVTDSDGVMLLVERAGVS